MTTRGFITSKPANGARASLRPVSSGLLQRKCACGGTSGPGGECESCRKKRETGLQRKAMDGFGNGAGFNRVFGDVGVASAKPLAITSPDDSFEHEADRVADAVVSGRGAPVHFSSSASMLQRDDAQTGPPPPKKEPSNEEKYQAALKKFGEAMLETPAGKELKSKAEELGKDFVSSVEGKVIAGTALGGALAALIAANKELPVPIPEIPLDFISPGLKAKLVWEGPVRNPTGASLTLTTKSGVSVGASYSKTEATPGKPAEEKSGLTLTIPLGGSPAKPKSDADKNEKYRADTARMAADQDKFREGMKPAAQKAAENKEYWDTFWRMKAGGNKKDDLMLMRRATQDSAGVGAAPPIVHDVLRSSGQPLDAATRSFMEPRFGHDFSRVRVHADARSAESAQAVNALAYTVGEDIAFSAGHYDPHSGPGQKLLAHELTHTIQQSSGFSPTATPRIAAENDPAEGEANGVAERVVSSNSFDASSQISRQSAGVISRQTASSNVNCPAGKHGAPANAEDILEMLKVFAILAVTLADAELTQLQLDAVLPGLGAGGGFTMPTGSRAQHYTNRFGLPSAAGAGKFKNRLSGATFPSQSQALVEEAKSLQARYSKISDFLGGSSIRFQCITNSLKVGSCDADCSTAAAFGCPTVIVLCPQFWTFSRQTQSQLLIHEVAHSIFGILHSHNFTHADCYAAFAADAQGTASTTTPVCAP